MATPLQEFLVTIRYSEDEASRRRTESSLKSYAGTLLKLTAGVVGMAAAIAKTTYEIGKGINSIYLTAKDFHNSSIQQFKGITEAAKDAGSSVEEMSAALAGMGKFRRTTGAGATEYLRQLIPGITGKESDTQLMKMMVANIPAIKKQYSEESFIPMAEAAGIPYEISHRMYEGQFTSKDIQKHEAAAGTGLDQIAPTIHEEFVRFGVDMDKMTNALAGTFGQSLSNVIDGELKIFEMGLKGFNENKDEIKAFTDKFTGAFDKLITKFDEQQKPMTRIAEALEKLTDPLKLVTDNLGMVASTVGILSALVALNPRAVIGGSGSGAIPLLKALLPVFRPGMAAVLSGYLGYQIGEKIDENTGISSKLGIGTYNVLHDENGENILSNKADALARWANKDNSSEAVKNRQNVGLGAL